MAITDDSPSSYLERIQWRASAFQWLRENRQYDDFSLDSCLGKLEGNPANREAALAAFWGVYLSDELPPVLEDLQHEKIRKLLDDGSQRNLRSADIRDLAFVRLHLNGLLAVCLIRPDWPIAESPSVVHILEKAKEAYELANPPSMDINDPPGWGNRLLKEDLLGFSTILVDGIIRVELALRRAEQGKYEEAFQLINGAAWDMCATNVESESDQLANFVPYLPHSGRRFDIQEAIDIFEEVKRHARNISAWEDVEICCEVFRYLGFFNLYDPNMQVIRPFIAEGLSALEYWGRAATFAEEQKRIVASPLPILTRDAVERTETKERLRRDFFGDLWEEIGKKTQDILVDAEIEWMHSRLDNMVKEIRQLLEVIFVDVFPFLERTAQQKDRRLILTRIRDELRENQARDSIDRLKIDNSDKIWIKDEMAKFLHTVIDARNYFEKERHLPGKKSDKYQGMKEKAISIHNKLLGIGCEGVLPRLMRIKKAIS
jgi:hypothetical protein